MGDAVFVSGPIGVGKTTLGRAVASQLGAAFMDGDDYSDHTRPWFASALSTSRGIATAALGALAQCPLAIVAYPLGCVSFVYYRRQIGDAGHRAWFVTLRASAAAILAEGRGRVFSVEERERIREMIAEGYGERPFSDIIIDTDARPFEETGALLATRITSLIG